MVRKEDCPAVSVCATVGQIKKNCVAKYGVEYNGVDTQMCIANLILLVSRMIPATVELHLSSEPVPPHGDHDEKKGGEQTG